MKIRVGENIKKFRVAKGWTQEELADKVGLSKNGLWNYENGKREVGIDTLDKIAEALGIKISELIEESNVSVVSRVGENIKKARKAKGMGQAELAEALGKSLRMVQKYETSDSSKTSVIPTIDILEDIATILEVGIQDLLGLGIEEDIRKFIGREFADIQLVQLLSSGILKLYNDKKIQEYEIKVMNNSFSFYVLCGNGYGGVIKGTMYEECKGLGKFIGDIVELESRDTDGEGGAK